MNVWEVIEVAFESSPSRAEVQPKLDRTLALYGESVNDDMRNRAASALVALRQHNGIDEMTILNYMIRSHVPGVNLTFAETAGLSAAFLKAGDR